MATCFMNFEGGICLGRRKAHDPNLSLSRPIVWKPLAYVRIIILFLVNAVPVTETTSSVGGLLENKAGLGQPNEASAKIVAKHPYGRFLESNFGCATFSPFVFPVFK